MILEQGEGQKEEARDPGALTKRSLKQLWFALQKEWTALKTPEQSGLRQGVLLSSPPFQLFQSAVLSPLMRQLWKGRGKAWWTRREKKGSGRWPGLLQRQSLPAYILS